MEGKRRERKGTEGGIEGGRRECGGKTEGVAEREGRRREYRQNGGRRRIGNLTLFMYEYTRMFSQGMPRIDFFISYSFFFSSLVSFSVWDDKGLTSTN